MIPSHWHMLPQAGPPIDIQGAMPIIRQSGEWQELAEGIGVTFALPERGIKPTLIPRMPGILVGSWEEAQDGFARMLGFPARMRLFGNITLAIGEETDNM